MRSTSAESVALLEAWTRNPPRVDQKPSKSSDSMKSKNKRNGEGQKRPSQHPQHQQLQPYLGDADLNAHKVASSIYVNPFGSTVIVEASRDTIDISMAFHPAVDAEKAVLALEWISRTLKSVAASVRARCTFEGEIGNLGVQVPTGLGDTLEDESSQFGSN